ncbi:hypothetical protein NMG60_11012237 [Bertholletia excelsa]
MASSLPLKRLSSVLLPSYLRTARPAVSVVRSGSRSFNTNVAYDFDEDDEHNLDVDRRSSRSVHRGEFAPNSPGNWSSLSFWFLFLLGSFHSLRALSNGMHLDLSNSFPTTRSLNQILNVMDRFMDHPFATASRGFGAGPRRSWDVKETDDGLYLRIDMPGLGKEHVKVSLVQNTLIIKGEGEKEPDKEESGQRYTSRIDLPENLYKTDQVKAEMKNGVLKVVVPKVKEEDRADVVHVRVE